MPEPILRASRGTVLGFDYGAARIGVALGELETATANACTTIATPVNSERFAAIAALIEQWQPVALVVGMPFGLDGQRHELSAQCARFANRLRGRFALPVFEYDERLSSCAADQALRTAGQRRWQERKKNLDAHAAQIILQDYLNEYRSASLSAALA